jgi:hypothetical protein
MRGNPMENIGKTMITFAFAGAALVGATTASFAQAGHIGGGTGAGVQHRSTGYAYPAYRYGYASPYSSYARAPVVRRHFYGRRSYSRY